LRNARHLSRLVDDVLDLSQIESGQMALVRSICNVADIVQSAVMVVLPLFQSKGLSLETELPPNLPEVFWDEIRIRQILINLLANSGRFTQTGGAVVRASIEANDILFIVQDSGPGIPYEQQSRLFEPFQQADFGLRREHGGSGLGLSISKHFVELHGGKIGLQSSPGTGTTITFRLPVHYDLEPVGQPADRASRWFNPYSSNQVRTRPFTAFLPSNLAHYIVVDQDTVLSYFLKRYMQDVRVTVVPTIDQALKEVARAPAYAMLINDPGILSPEQYHQILAKLEALPYQTPAIVFWQPGKLDIVRQLGVLDYIIKPVNAAALLTAVQKSGENIETVLLVDDEEDSLQLLMRILLSSDRKYRILRSYTGEDALYVMRTQKPDLVLLDMSIPDKDGLRILQEKTADEDIRHIPVLVVSATDPVQETFTANTLLVKRASSLSMVELIQFIQSVSQVFLPEELSGEPVSKGNPVD
jgi:DNA-binding response OmpR family regulator